MTDWQEVLHRAGFPTEAVVLDFETFFDKDYSINKMSTIEYVTDERFELTGLAGYNLTDEYAGEESWFWEPYVIAGMLKAFQKDWGKSLERITVVCQNANFDCLILRHHFGITPKFIVDIMDLDKMWDARDRHNLEHMAKKWGTPTLKGDTKQFEGLHWSKASPTKRKKLQAYAVNDVEIEAWLFKKLMATTVSRPEVELPVANLTHQMYLNPTFEIDSELGQEIVTGMRVEMQKPLDRLRRRGVKAAPKKTFQETISSNICFAELLIEALPEGETLPVKPGKPTKNMIPLTGPGRIPAFAKDDEGMYQLLHHSKPQVRRLAEAKQALNSWPLHIKKVENIMRQAACQDGFIGSPLGYHNAHTARWGGTEKINLQNLGGRGRGGKGTHELIRRVRNMLRAPKGYVLGIQDYSKVEAVGVAWQAGQRDLLEAFRIGADAYSDLATELFGHEVRKPERDDLPEVASQMEIERGFGKDAILGCGYGMGAVKFYDRCYANEELRPKFDDGTFDVRFVENVIKTYRRKYNQIPAYWQKLEQAWRWVTKYPGERRKLPRCQLEFFNKDGATFIRLPSGRLQRYPHARVDRGLGQCKYHWGPLWGGTLTENVVSSLCRDFIAESMLRLQEAGFWVVLTVHDEIVTFLPEAHAEEKLQEMGEIMTVVPSWAKGFPLQVEGKLSEVYCK